MFYCGGEDCLLETYIYKGCCINFLCYQLCSAVSCAPPTYPCDSTPSRYTHSLRKPEHSIRWYNAKSSTRTQTIIYRNYVSSSSSNLTSAVMRPIPTLYDLSSLRKGATLTSAPISNRPQATKHSGVSISVVSPLLTLPTGTPEEIPS